MMLSEWLKNIFWVSFLYWEFIVLFEYNKTEKSTKNANIHTFLSNMLLHTNGREYSERRRDVPNIQHNKIVQISPRFRRKQLSTNRVVDCVSNQVDNRWSQFFLVPYSVPEYFFNFPRSHGHVSWNFKNVNWWQSILLLIVMAVLLVKSFIPSKGKQSVRCIHMAWCHAARNIYCVTSNGFVTFSLPLCHARLKLLSKLTNTYVLLLFSRHLDRINEHVRDILIHLFEIWVVIVIQLFKYQEISVFFFKYQLALVTTFSRLIELK